MLLRFSGNNRALFTPLGRGVLLGAIITAEHHIHHRAGLLSREIRIVNRVEISFAKILSDDEHSERPHRMGR